MKQGPISPTDDTSVVPAISKKRKRPEQQTARSDYQQQQQQQQLDRIRKKYDSLVHQCRKALNKVVKTAKGLERQSTSRKLVAKRQQRRSDEKNKVRSSIDDAVAEDLKQKQGDSSRTALTSSSSSLTTVERYLQALKNFDATDCSQVVQMCVERLGLPHLDPSRRKAARHQPEQQRKEHSANDTLQQGAEEDNTQDINNDSRQRQSGNKDEPSSKFTAKDDDEDKQLVLKRMLQHKKVVEAMELWDSKVSDYQKWYRRQTISSSSSSGREEGEGINRNKIKSKKQKPPEDAVTGLFVALGGAAGASNDSSDSFWNDDESGLYADNDGDEVLDSILKPKKANRKGQRQRRAKAMALQAKREGRSHFQYKSVNWRDPNKQNKGEEEENEQASARRNRSKKNDGRRNGNDGDHHGKTTTTKKPMETTDAAMAHPSWAAKRAATQSNIVAFQGKKITFGDD